VKRTRILIPVLVVLVLFAITACNPKPKGSVATLPADWPMQYLTLPDGSTEALLPINMRHPESTNHHISHGPSSSGEVWMIAFYCELSFNELKIHVEECIAGKGFTSVEDDMSNGSRHEIYQTPDGLHRIKIGYSNNTTDEHGNLENAITTVSF
jgi:hypothetical protein